jgi:F-type H+-transporting ATPase subunit delta
MAEAELSTVARPYARAAFSKALNESSGLETWSRMLKMLSATVQEASVAAVLDSPATTTEEETKFLIELLGEELNQYGKNFVTVISEYGRTALIPEISSMFELLKAHHEQTLDVEITSAFDVSESDQELLSKVLKDKLQRDIQLSTGVDESLIGGVLIKAEDTVIDNSVRGKLEKLSHALT